MSERGRKVYLRSAVDKAKAFSQYDELRRGGQVARALVIAEMRDGSLSVLGSSMTPLEMGSALAATADALARAIDFKKEVRPGDPHVAPERPGEKSGDRPLPRRTGDAPDGTMTPPLGEGWLSCGECDRPRFYVSHWDWNDSIARLVCIHCRNEMAIGREEAP